MESKLTTASEPDDANAVNRRRRQADVVLDGQVSIRQMTDHNNSVHTFWTYWSTTILPLETRSSKWRTGSVIVNRCYNEQMFYVREIARTVDANGIVGAIQAAQERLTSFSSWTTFRKALVDEQPSGPVRNALNEKVLALMPTHS